MKRSILSIAVACMLIAWKTVSGEIINSDTTIDYLLEDNVNVVDGIATPTVVDIIEPAEITGYLRARDTSTVNLLGGSIGIDLESGGFSTLNISGGSVGRHVEASASSTVNMSGGSIGQRLRSLESTVINLSGGSIGTHLFAYANSVVNMSGGTVNMLMHSLGQSTVNISGGTVKGELTAWQSSTVNVSGGRFEDRLFASNSATVNIFGHDLQLSGGHLTGTLADGTPLDHVAITYYDGQFLLHEVPEPPALISLATAGISGLLVCLRRRWSSRCQALRKGNRGSMDRANS